MPVYGLSHGGGAFGAASGHLVGLLEVAAPGDPAGFADGLLALDRRFDGALIIETMDLYSEAIAAERPRLERRFRLATPRAVETFMNKDRAAELAARCGVPRPDGRTPAIGADPRAELQGLRMPCIVKPLRSHEFVARFGVKVFAAATTDEAVAGVRRAHEAGLAVMVQEAIPGSAGETMEKVYLYVGSDGEITAEMFAAKLRQTPPDFGVGRVARTTGVLPEARRLARRLLEASDFRGYAAIEFKRDPRDGVLRFIELNVRIARTNALALAAGVDFAWLMYRDLVDGVRERIPGYRIAHYVDPVADVGNLVLLRDDLRDLTPRRLLGPYLSRPVAFDPFARDDPAPGRAYLRDQARSFAGRILPRRS